MTSGPVARDKLLRNAERYILRHGLLDLTLTALAEGIGSNRRMLLYHFSSLDELVREAVGDIIARRELTTRLIDILDGDGALVDRLDAAWAHIADPAQESWHRLYFAQLGRAIEDPSTYEAFLDQSKMRMTSLLVDAVAGAGIPEPEPVARSLSALWSGLQIALLSGAGRGDLAEAHHAAAVALLGGVPARR
ncbi:TetR family transcriptional regulator [Frondihabitans sp. PhB188]|uniref:TetR/AcrR family transcriptional regulator n=1 Tax=Frondihabitans sp. PhB188 TaxID=2485200 RepID=UPI000F4640DF|nr:TetR family transcriptional regulator [Frondihabitans sp. PhB188]ROQ40722.1 TetR family transcriptional regulator [Frondihabitans sp. PhB188]